MSKKVIIGISGGVDSSVAALLLQEQGFCVEAVFMKNWEEKDSDTDPHSSSCTAAQDFVDARSVCDQLHIPLHVVNFSQEYWQRVFQYMLDEYAKGRTPNPDIMCNKEIKFKEFLNHAKTLNADYIATGHYARNICANNKYKLYKALDQSKDQSYFLYTLGQQQLAYTLFPLGNLLKSAVRDIAKKAHLSNHAKKDSTGICFIGERNFKKFLSEYLLAKPGEIVTTEEEIIGKHDGLMFYTLGQRQGLGIGGKKGAPEAPWYVVKKDLINNKLIIAQNPCHPLLMSKVLHCEEIHWICSTKTGFQDMVQIDSSSLDFPRGVREASKRNVLNIHEHCEQTHNKAENQNAKRIAEKQPEFPLQCLAKIRYRQTEQPCTINKITEQNYCVTFVDAQRAITPGQAAVFYAEDGECLGGGTIM